MSLTHWPSITHDYNAVQLIIHSPPTRNPCLAMPCLTPVLKAVKPRSIPACFDGAYRAIAQSATACPRVPNEQSTEFIPLTSQMPI